jgi:signal transduction histidine kinase
MRKTNIIRGPEMGEDSDKNHGRSHSKVLKDLVIIVILAVVVFIVAVKLDIAEVIFSFLQNLEPLEIDELVIVCIMLVFALAVFSIRLWHELKLEMREHEMIADSLNRANTKLTLLNSITRQDILNQLTELYGDLEHAEQKPLDPEVRPCIIKVKDMINRIRRQIKFTKEYQDIGVHTPEWQNVADTVTRARVGVDLGKVALDVEIHDVEIFADRLLEKVFYYMIDNALKHGGEKLSRIRFYDHMSGDNLVIICDDDGVGIPADKKVFLFPEEYGKHFGYGLFLIKEILSITDIKIRETGVPGKGARFEIHVPKGAYRRVGIGIVK